MLRTKSHRDITSTTRAMPLPTVKRTYASNRSLRPALPSSPVSSYTSDPFEVENASLNGFQLEVEEHDSSSLPPSSPVRPTTPTPLVQLSPVLSPTRVTGKRKRDVMIGAENDRELDSDRLAKSSSVNGTKARPVRVNLLDYLVPKARSSPSMIHAIPSSAAKKKTSKSTLSSRTVTKKRVVPSSESDTINYSSSIHPTSSPSSSRTPTARTPKPSTLTPGSKKLKQLHLSLGQKSSIRTCPLCSLSYTRGTPEDEELHKKHCARIVRGAEWGKEEARFEGGVVTVIEDGIRVKVTKEGKAKQEEEKGRIVCFRGDVGGKLGAKVCWINTCNLPHLLNRK